jgi:hypothetical protein
MGRKWAVTLGVSVAFAAVPVLKQPEPAKVCPPAATPLKASGPTNTSPPVKP